MHVLLDFETQSRADLKRIGGRLYWEHPSTKPICCAWYRVETGEVGMWRPGDPRPITANDTPVAHNATGFDRFGALRLGWCPIEREWIDTSELARKAGLPGALDALGTRWLGLEKDKDASRFTIALSSVKRPKAISADDWRELSREEKRERGDLPQITPEARARVEPYCLLDVQIMAEGWDRLHPWQEIDEDISRVDRIINDRGVPFDAELAECLLECDRINTERVIASVARELGWSASEVRAAANSPAQFTEITGAADARKGTVAGIDHPLARARQALASIVRGKLEAGLARMSRDGYLRDTHRYYGAGTGRWSQRGMQLHNMLRPPKMFEKIFDDNKFDEQQIDDWICGLADRVKAADHIATPAECQLLLRSTIAAPAGYSLAVCDFSGVEARANAWAAGDYKALEVFRSGRDPYKVMAASMFGCAYEDISKDWRRTLGKQAELGCGYGMGGLKFEATCLAAGIDLDDVGVDGRIVVNAWRKLHAPIVRFWRDCEDAFTAACAGGEAQVSCFTFVPGDDGEVLAWLPSGRPIVYQGARISGHGLVYDGGHGEEHIYGGKIVENLIQAFCRDLMARALVLAEEAGLLPVMHVHDEIVCMVPAQTAKEGYGELKRIMTSLPEWAEGFPIGAAGFHGRGYRK